MFRIGVLEDETSNFDELKRYIQRYGEENNVSFEIERHTDGQKFLEDQFSNYDVIFLDIEVPGASGLQVAEQIRERDKDVVIFFCTRLSQYAIYGYQVDAMDYILKPVRYSSIKMRLDKALHRVQKNRNNEKIVLRINRGSVRLSISEIYYVEASKHKMMWLQQLLRFLKRAPHLIDPMLGVIHRFVLAVPPDHRP